jgi:hypothetical protein
VQPFRVHLFGNKAEGFVIPPELEEHVVVLHSGLDYIDYYKELSELVSPFETAPGFFLMTGPARPGPGLAYPWESRIYAKPCYRRLPSSNNLPHTIIDYTEDTQVLQLPRTPSGRHAPRRDTRS